LVKKSRGQNKNSADYGVPQMGKRLIVIAGLNPKLAFPGFTHGQKGQRPYSTVGEWIFGLAPLQAGEIDSIDPDHSGLKLSPKNLN
jgi:site-specific DNA-cytosine methylase